MLLTRLRKNCLKATRLSLIAHGPTAAQRAGRFANEGEPIIAGALPTLRAGGMLLCAPEQRCRDSARLLGEPQVCGALRECNFGRWQGMGLHDIQQAEPAALVQWLHDPGAAPHGGESFSDVCERVGQWLDALHPGQYTVITHPWVLRAAFAQGLQLPAANVMRIDIEPWAHLRMTKLDHWRVRL